MLCPGVFKRLICPYVTCWMLTTCFDMSIAIENIKGGLYTIKLKNFSDFWKIELVVFKNYQMDFIETAQFDLEGY